MAISGGDAILGRAAILLGAEVDPKFASEAEKGILGPLQKIATHATAILAGAFVAHKLFDFLKESAKLAAEDEHSIHLLQFALEALNVSAADQAGAEKWIEQMERARGVMDDELRPALAQAARFTQDLTKAEELLGLAQDISIGRGLPLINVVTALGKAYTGNVAQLQRLGLAIKDSTGHALTSKEAFEKLFQQFGGLGESAMDTAEGRARAFNVAIDEMKEQVGRLLLPVLMQFADILIDDVIPPIRSIIGFLGDLNGLTDGWAGKVVAATATVTALAFAFKTLVGVGAAVKLFMATTLSQLGTGAAVAASYAGGILGVGGATATSTAVIAASVPVTEAAAVAAAQLALADANLAVQSALTAAAVGAEQLSLFGEAAALEAVQIEMFPTTVATEALALAQGEAAVAASVLTASELRLAEAEAAAAAGAVELGVAANAAKVSLIGVLGPLALLVTGGVLLGRTLDHMFPEGDNPVSKAVKEIITDMQSFSTEDFRAELQQAVDRLHDLGFHPFEQLRKDFDEILKKTPQFAQQFLDVAKSLKGGEEGTKGWQAEINTTIDTIRKANAAQADWQAQIDGTTGLIDEEADALIKLSDQIGVSAITTLEAEAANISLRDAMDLGKQATEDYTKRLQDHADAYAGLVDAIGPLAAAMADTGNLTTEQLQQMADDANQFAADFASALHDAADPLSFFGDQTDITADQLRKFLEQSLAATQAWAQNLQYATAIGIDQGFIQELAKAGPRSAPILQATIKLASDTSVAVTNQLLTGTRNVGVISHNLWSGMSLDAILAARNMIHSVQDLLGWISALGAATKAALTGPAKMPPLPTLDSVGVPKINTSGSRTAVDAATDAVAESLKRLQDQFKIGEITEQQLADQAGSMWNQTEKFSSSWMTIWEILNQNAIHIQDTSDKAGKAAQDAADTAAKAAQEAADKAAKAAADAAEKIAEAAAKAAAEYTEAFDEIVAVLGKFGAAAVKTRGLTTEQLKAMASDIRSFQSAVASSFASASNAIAAFGNDVEVTGQQLLDFQQQSLADAREWSVNITRLMQMGLDASLLRPLAEAGPKAGALVKAYLDEIGLVGVNAVNQIARDQARVLAQTTATLTGGIAWGPTQQTQPQPSQVVNSMFTVQGSVYGVADLNAFMDQRDAVLAAAIGAGQR